jgi:hypothetical protein
VGSFDGLELDEPSDPDEPEPDDELDPEPESEDEEEDVDPPSSFLAFEGAFEPERLSVA